MAEFDRLITMFEEQIQFNRMLGMKVDSIGPGEAVLRLPFREDFVGDPIRPALHGGVLSTLIDTCGGLAVFTRLEAGVTCSTVDLRVDYLEPAGAEDLVARARILRLGNRVAVVDVQVLQSSPETLVAAGKAVYNLNKPRDLAKSSTSPKARSARI